MPFIEGDWKTRSTRTMMETTIGGHGGEGIVYKGVLYGGLMLEDSRPYVIEFNARFGDPETQPILFQDGERPPSVPDASATGRLDTIGPISWKHGVAICVVIASRGYPEKPEKGKLIKGLESSMAMKDVWSSMRAPNRIGADYYTSGGRVLGITALGDTYAMR